MVVYNIYPHSQVAIHCKEDLINDGSAAFQSIKNFRGLKLDDTQGVGLTDEWDEATLTKVGVEITSNSNLIE